jgi:hypothetical protein
MPRLRNVVLTAALAALVLAVWLSLHGCDQDATAPDIRQQLAQEQQRREVAENTGRRWQVVAVCLGSAAVLTLVVGAALGSRARHDARRSRPDEPQE